MNTLVEGEELETWNVTKPSKDTSEFFEDTSSTVVIVDSAILISIILYLNMIRMFARQMSVMILLVAVECCDVLF